MAPRKETIGASKRRKKFSREVAAQAELDKAEGPSGGTKVDKAGSGFTNSQISRQVRTEHNRRASPRIPSSTSPTKPKPPKRDSAPRAAFTNNITKIGKN